MDRRAGFAFLVAGVATQLAWATPEVHGQELPSALHPVEPSIDDLGAKYIEAPVAESTAAPVKVEEDPKYLITEIRVNGNRRTRESLILANIGLSPGAVVAVDDPKLSENRRRLLALGLFLDVELTLTKGATRGDAVLTVKVTERGSLIVDDIFVGKSEATSWWAGVGITETNLLGRGIRLGGGVLFSARPEVDGAESAAAGRLNLLMPLDGMGATWIRTRLLASRSSEFFSRQVSFKGSEPTEFVASRLNRMGADLAFGLPLSPTTRMWFGGRGEYLDADLPLALSGIDYKIDAGNSFLSALVIGIEIDTTSHRPFPRHGYRLMVDLDNSLPVIGSSYTYHRTNINAQRFFRVANNHAIALRAFAGAIVGEAPYIDQYFVGDLNPLLPSRMMGVNTSTRPSHNWLSSSINDTRYGNYAGRLTIEYAIPLWRAPGPMYAADAFVSAGVFSLAQTADLRTRGRSGLDGIPIEPIGDVGVRVDTAFGVFLLSVGNAVGRMPF